MERSINIENGGTLTDICVWDGTEFTVTKTLTTPFDLRRFFDGITTASAEICGRPALSELLHSTKHIRCSTTQGTNALVDPKGPRIGLITDDIAVVGELPGFAAERAVFDDLVGDRVAVIDVELSDKELTGELVRQVNRLTTDGAARLVVAAAMGSTAPSGASAGSCFASSRGICLVPSRSCTRRSSPRTACGRVGSGRACSIPSCIRPWSDSSTTPRIGCAATGPRTLC